MGASMLCRSPAEWTLNPADFDLPGLKLVYLANPNSPSGTSLPREQVAELAEALPCPLIVDEAYADFAQDHCVDLVREHPNVIVTRSFSKGYSLAGIRLGYLVAQPAVVAQLLKIKDSYNCDTLSLAAGVAALTDQDYLGLTRSKILATRRPVDRRHFASSATLFPTARPTLSGRPEENLPPKPSSGSRTNASWSD